MPKFSGEDIFNELKHLLRKIKYKKNIEIRISNLRNNNILINLDARSSLEASRNEIIDTNFQTKAKLTAKEFSILKTKLQKLVIKMKRCEPFKIKRIFSLNSKSLTINKFLKKTSKLFQKYEVFCKVRFALSYGNKGFSNKYVLRLYLGEKGLFIVYPDKTELGSIDNIKPLFIEHNIKIHNLEQLQSKLSKLLQKLEDKGCRCFSKELMYELDTSSGNIIEMSDIFTYKY